jgi:hypothetical protein
MCVPGFLYKIIIWTQTDGDNFAALQKPTSLRSLHLAWRVYTPEKCRMADHPGHHSPLTHWYHSNNHVNSSQSEAANKKKNATTVTLRDGPAESNTVVQRFLRSRLIGRLGVSRSLRPCQQRHMRRAHVTTTQILFRTAIGTPLHQEVYFEKQPFPSEKVSHAENR